MEASTFLGSLQAVNDLFKSRINLEGFYQLSD